jgi:hypothetical protein
MENKTMKTTTRGPTAAKNNNNQGEAIVGNANNTAIN